MGTTLDSVMKIMMPLIPEDYKTDIVDDVDLAYRGIIEMGIALHQTYTFVTEEVLENGVLVTKITGIEETLDMFKTFLASHFAYRAYLMRLKDELNRDAINFKTLTFEIKSLEKRPTAVNDSIYSLNRYLNDTIKMINGASSIIGTVTQIGKSDE